MAVTTETQSFLTQIEQMLGPDPAPVDIHSLQAVRENSVVAMISEQYLDVTSEDLNLEGPHGELLIRVYRPQGAVEPTPVIVFFHGGGYVNGSVNGYDPICRKLAHDSGFAVASVDYHLSPEVKFPVAIEEGYWAAQWIYNHAAEMNFNPEKIVIAGDSSGGNLAATVVLAARDQKTLPIAYQVLIYPWLNLSCNTESYSTYDKGYFITTADLKVISGFYLSRMDEQLTLPQVSPILADGHHLPPTMILTAEFDPIYDDGKYYADKLSSAGVEVAYKNYEGVIHGFIGLIDLFPEARTAFADLVSELKSKLL